DNPGATARVNAGEARRLGLEPGSAVIARTIAGAARLELAVDPRVPDGCVLLPAGYPETAALGAHGAASLTPAGRSCRSAPGKACRHGARSARSPLPPP